MRTEEGKKMVKKEGYGKRGVGKEEKMMRGEEGKGLEAVEGGEGKGRERKGKR